MKKLICLCLIAVLCLTALAGCECKHDWEDATCDEPKTCTKCGETEGEALEHVWKDATTEAPKTCTACGETKGERIITDERFTTAACESLFGRWQCRLEKAAYELGVSDTEDPIAVVITMNFDNEGNCEQVNSLEDPEAVETMFLSYLMDTMYASFELQGMDRAAADEAMIAAYGMGMEEYCKSLAESSGVTADAEYELVYYVDGDVLYVGTDWEAEMGSIPMEVDGDTLTLTNADGSKEVYTRVTE